MAINWFNNRKSVIKNYVQDNRKGLDANANVVVSPESLAILLHVRVPRAELIMSNSILALNLGAGITALNLVVVLAVILGTWERWRRWGRKGTGDMDADILSGDKVRAVCIARQ